MYEDLVILLVVFAATTIAALVYILLKAAPRPPSPKQTIVINSSEIPPQTDTRLSPIILQTEKNVEMLEKEVEGVLGGGEEKSG
ncbi:MAG: hypothetical protein QXN23_04595 [Candidatus Caldarchaeum sp.]|uniref:Uncharacterized protein n=1 Tax=Caldiarchaeum subterraneum TaxID=311458 RepID=A0A7C4I709_CALS0|nr:hypothetical protein [Candidatus Caldarchaeales archaeon]